MPKNTEYVTKTHFDKAIVRYVTKAHFDKVIAQYVTRAYFDDFMSRLLTKVALKSDLETLEARFDRLETKFDAGFTNLDTYLTRNEAWHDEQVILRASHQRLKDALVRKGIVSDSELAV